MAYAVWSTKALTVVERLLCSSTFSAEMTHLLILLLAELKLEKIENSMEKLELRSTEAKNFGDVVNDVITSLLSKDASDNKLSQRLSSSEIREVFLQQIPYEPVPKDLSLLDKAMQTPSLRYLLSFLRIVQTSNSTHTKLSLLSHLLLSPEVGHLIKQYSDLLLPTFINLVGDIMEGNSTYSKAEAVLALSSLPIHSSWGHVDVVSMLVASLTGSKTDIVNPSSSRHEVNHLCLLLLTSMIKHGGDSLREVILQNENLYSFLFVKRAIVLFPRSEVSDLKRKMTFYLIRYKIQKGLDHTCFIRELECVLVPSLESKMLSPRQTILCLESLVEIEDHLEFKESSLVNNDLQRLLENVMLRFANNDRVQELVQYLTIQEDQLFSTFDF